MDEQSETDESLWPVHEVRRRIAECQQRGASSLVLSALGLTSLPEELFEWTGLKTLNLHYNQLRVLIARWRAASPFTHPDRLRCGEFDASSDRARGPGPASRSRSVRQQSFDDEWGARPGATVRIAITCPGPCK